MIPDREFTFKVNEDAKLALEKHLGVEPHTIKVKKNRQQRLYGEITPWNRTITLYLGSDILTASSLTRVNKLVIETLLHEYRHAWQHKTWTAAELEEDDKLPYSLRRKEKDANEWAAANALKWLRLGKVVAKSPSVFASQNRRLAASGVGR